MFENQKRLCNLELTHLNDVRIVKKLQDFFQVGLNEFFHGEFFLSLWGQ